MHRHAIGFIFGLVGLAALPPVAVANEDIVLRGMGSFHIGGRIVEVTGKPVREIVRQPGGPLTKLDPNGQYMVEQMYVQYFLPKNKKGKLPLLMWHGGGLTGVTYESTPDGREGWMQHFIRQGWDTYMSDAVERGRSGFAPPDVWPSEPTFLTYQDPFERFRIGDGAGLVECRPGQAQGAAGQPVPGRGLRELHAAVGAALALDRPGDHGRVRGAGRQDLPVRDARCTARAARSASRSPSSGPTR